MIEKLYDYLKTASFILVILSILAGGIGYAQSDGDWNVNNGSVYSVDILTVEEIDSSDGNINAQNNSITNTSRLRTKDLEIEEDKTFASMDMTTNQTVEPNNETKLNFSQADHDDFGGFNSTNSTYVVQERGVYFVAIESTIDDLGNGNQMILRTYHNGSAIEKSTAQGASTKDVTGSNFAIDHFDANDTLYATVEHDASNSKDILDTTSSTHLHFMRLGYGVEP